MASGSPGILARSLKFGHLTRLGRRKAKGLTHTSPGQRPGKKQRIFIEGQRPVSYLNFKIFKILITPMPQSLSQVIVHIVFSTKNRQKWLDSAISRACTPTLPQYVVTTIAKLIGLAESSTMSTLQFVWTSTGRRSIIGQKPSRRSIANCCASTTLNSMNVTFGIDQRRQGTRLARGGGPMNRAVGARQSLLAPVPGALPQAGMN